MGGGAFTYVTWVGTHGPDEVYIRPLITSFVGYQVDSGFFDAGFDIVGIYPVSFLRMGWQF
ncbi:MAG: hypothetical protein S4CHLAM20_00580 [Chlamydiia bacterium]|nr:hypothetical protein [Chlamydiia bacterium]